VLLEIREGKGYTWETLLEKSMKFAEKKLIEELGELPIAAFDKAS
jgi:phosphoribosyl-ATP pyrophosphohydrolase